MATTAAEAGIMAAVGTMTEEAAEEITTEEAAATTLDVEAEMPSQQSGRKLRQS